MKEDRTRGGGRNEREIEIRRGRSREKHGTHKPKVSKETCFHQITTALSVYNSPFYRVKERGVTVKASLRDGFVSVDSFGIF